MKNFFFELQRTSAIKQVQHIVPSKLKDEDHHVKKKKRVKSNRTKYHPDDIMSALSTLHQTHIKKLTKNGLSTNFKLMTDILTTNNGGKRKYIYIQPK